ncbi:hypothetical protein Maq22A_c28370 [Methylobacterium aquaticum]|uniref:Uncharacterized protein n=1 Tax=Methylobacterium aquaticum TaxID=270351 RepID=A0A1Y0ZBU7_9HYPH|nr:hypothetical protein Maq22A_c28370 [Methylobacterium aquaticum]
MRVSAWSRGDFWRHPGYAITAPWLTLRKADQIVRPAPVARRVQGGTPGPAGDQQEAGGGPATRGQDKRANMLANSPRHSVMVWTLARCRRLFRRGPRARPDALAAASALAGRRQIVRRSACRAGVA